MKNTFFLVGILLFLVCYPIEKYWKKIRRAINTGYYGCKLHNIGKGVSIDYPVASMKGRRYISIGRSSFIGKNSVITAFDKHGTDNFTPEIAIGDFVTIGDDCHITSINRISIGNNVLLGKKVTITDNSHGQNRTTDESDVPPVLRTLHTKGAVIIKDRAWIGDKVTVCAGVTIGTGAIIGANSVVTNDVSDYSIVAGNPAIYIRSTRGGAIAIAILYYPDMKQVTENIIKYIDHIDKLILWDNTPKSDSANYCVELPTKYDSKIIRKTMGFNCGIAEPVNWAMQWAVKHNYDYLMTMDQDSCWNDFAHYKSHIMELANVGFEAIITPNVNNRYSKGNKIRPITSFITSGSVFPTSVIKRIGNYNNNLFVDGLDLEYSLRALRAEVNMVVLTDCGLQQNFGSPIKSTLLGFRTSNYSATRTYNIVKNHIIIYRQYKKLLSPPQKLMIFRGYIISRIIKIAFLEQHKLDKICSVFRGFKDGMIG